MKIIGNEDMKLITTHIQGLSCYTLKDFETILNDLGDEGFFRDGQFVRIKENEKMKKIRTSIMEAKKPMLIKEIYNKNDIVKIITEHASKSGTVTDVDVNLFETYVGHGPMERKELDIEVVVTKKPGSMER